MSGNVGNEDDPAARAYALVSSQLASWNENTTINDFGVLDDDITMMEDDYNDTISQGYDERNKISEIQANNESSRSLNINNSGDNFEQSTGVMAPTTDQDFRFFPSAHVASSSSSLFSRRASSGLDSNDEIFMNYFEILYAFYQKKRSMETSSFLSEASKSSHQGGNSIDLQETLFTDLSYLNSLLKLCKSVATESRNTEEKAQVIRQIDLWSLIILLRRQDGLIDYQSDSDKRNKSTFLLNTKNGFQSNQSVTNISNQLHSSPPEILKLLLQTNSNFQRHHLILKWVSSSLSFKRSILLPPSRRNVMWPVWFQMGKPVDPDAPFIHTQDGLGILPGTDQSDEVDFMKSLLHLFQSDHISKVVQLCSDVGQPWRAATFSGGLNHTLHDIEEALDMRAPSDNGDDDDDDDDFFRESRVGEKELRRKGKWNPNYFLWKENCSKLAKHSHSLAVKSKLKDHPATLYESAFYSILSCDLDMSLSNPLMRSWEEGVHLCFYALVHRQIDELLVKHFNLQRSVGKRFPFKSYLFKDTSKSDQKLLERTSNLSSLTEEKVFNMLAESSHESIRNESVDLIRLLTSCFVIGKTCVVEFINNYASDLSETENNSTSSEHFKYLPFMVHVGIFLSSILPIASDLFKSMQESQQVLLLKYMQNFLYPKSHLWKCVPLYTSLLAGETEQIVEHKEFLKQVVDKSMRKEMMDRARNYFPKGMDLKVVKLLLDEIFIQPLEKQQQDIDSSSMYEKQTEDDAMIKKMKMIEWLLFYPEHRLDAVWYANVLLRNLLLRNKDSHGKYMSHAQYFLKFIFPKDSIDIVRELYDDDDDSLECEDSNSINDDMYWITEENESLCLFIDANTAYESWRVEVDKCTFDVKQALSDEPPKPTDFTTVGKSNESSSMEKIEFEIATKRYYRTQAKKIQAAMERIVLAAKEASELLHSILSYPGGWLASSDQKDKRLALELEQLRMVCIPETVFLLQNIYNQMGNWMESIICRQDQDLITLLNVDKYSELQAQYWYRKSLSIVNLVAHEDDHIQGPFSSDNMKKFLGIVRNTGVKLLRTQSEDSSAPLSLSSANELYVDDDDDL